MITKGSTLTKPPIRTTVFFVFDYNTSDEHRIYFNQLESEFLLGIFEVFIHSTSQLDVWRASTKVNLFIPKVPPHKNNLQNPWNPKSYSPIFFFGQPPAPSLFLSFFQKTRTPCILDDGESFVEKNIKKHLRRGVSFCPEGPKQPPYFFRFGGRFSDYAKKRKALKLAREKAASRSCQGWKSQVEVTMGACLRGGLP